MEFWIPYGETEVPVSVPDDNFYKILEPTKPRFEKDPVLLVKEALDKPVEGVSLAQLAKMGGSAGIMADSMVPPSILKHALETIKSRLQELGVTTFRVFIRKHTSNVQLPSQEEYQAQILDPSQGTFAEIGRTSAGTPVSLQQECLDCDAKITVGMVTPHFASGFTSGPETLLPGASSIETVTKNRSLVQKGGFTRSATANPVLADTLEACRLGGPVYSLALVPDGWGGLDSAFAGELEQVHNESTTRYMQVHGARIDRKPDIILVSAGSRLGMDLYHGVRVIPNVWDTVRKEGTIILVAECSKGTGDQTFQDYNRKFQERKELLNELRHRFKLGGHVSLLLKEAVDKNRVQLVSVLPDYYIRDCFKTKPSRTASTAIQTALRAEGKDAKILIVKHGDVTIPVLDMAS